MKKILIISTSLKTRGGISAVVNAHLTSNLYNQFDVKIIETHIDKSSIIKIYYFVKPFFKFIFNVFRCDLIHLHFSEPVSLIRKIPFVIFSSLLNKCIISHLHAPGHIPELNKNYHFLYNYIFIKSNDIIVLSKTWKNMVISDFKVNENKVHTISNPCAPIISKVPFVKKKQILFAGSLIDRKNYKTLIYAFSKIINDFPDWKLIICGNGQLGVAKELVAELKINNNVEFLGWVSGESKHKAFSEASMFCLPSFAEGLPMAILDAFSYHIPVISSKVGGIVDFVSHNHDALLFDPNSIDELYDCLKRIITDNSLKNKLIKGSMYMSKIVFSLSNIEKEILKIYKKY